MNDKDRGNRGIVISGNGKIVADAISAGDHARAVSRAQKNLPDERLVALLRYEVNQLVESIARQAAQLHPTVQSSAETLKAETQKALPEKSKVMSLLQQIADGAKSAATITQSVTAVMAVAAAVFS